ncbi:hypothetical protein BS47DRAFT_1039053 [Hydnum rufescens UP504]|uniref:RING-type domain-containing protein n=1 Tax=Hydnum rufescens UP504 TaxID=1448309 RepID=A0A9P6AWI6_9AGAM|nr:hypothetical protein BS47DRAFT_1039053 [Hydnum rufescens UP504]
MFRCSICYENEEALGALPCGHVFCLPCLTSHFGYSPSCPKCRDRCSQTDILKLYLDESEQAAPPLATSDSSDLVDRIPRIEALSAKATELDIEATKEQLASVVTPGEILLLDLERHGGTDIQPVLAKLSESLASLRNKLKYAAKLTSMKAEHQQYVRTIEHQEEKMRAQTKEKHLAFRELDAVQRKLDKLEAKDTEWRNKYERLRQRFIQLEHRGVAENEVQRIKIAQLQEKVRSIVALAKHCLTPLKVQEGES